MPFWPLVFAFIAANYYSIWRKRWYLILALSIIIYDHLLHRTSNSGAVDAIISVLATLVFLPLLFIIGELLYRRWR
jgi:hypothetical protein